MMKKLWKRWVSVALTLCMMLSFMPTPVLAALIDNPPDRNAELLQELKDFWGDDKTAEEALLLLKEHGLVDEDGNILTGWDGEITIAEGATPAVFSDVFQYEGKVVTVNSRACPTAELVKILTQLEDLGALQDDTLAADWGLTWNGESIAPGALLVKLRSTQEEPDVPAEPETPAEPGAPVEPKAANMPNGLELPTGAAMLGAEADPEALLSVLTFLDNYALLSDHGAKLDWGMAFPGQSRPTNLSELTAMLEDGKTDRNQIITVDGTEITLEDFETMLEIEKEIKRIQDTYFSDHTGELTPEHEDALKDLRNQIMQDGGIELYNTNGANDLVFPSGTDHSQRIQVPEEVQIDVYNGNPTAEVTITLDHPAESEISFNWEIQQGAMKLEIDGKTRGTAKIGVGEDQVVLTIKSSDAIGTWNHFAVAALQFTNPKGALFSNGKTAITTRIAVYNFGLEILCYLNPSDTPAAVYIGGSAEPWYRGKNWFFKVEMSGWPLSDEIMVKYNLDINDYIKKLLKEGTVTRLVVNMDNRFKEWTNPINPIPTQETEVQLYLDNPDGTPYRTIKRTLTAPEGQNFYFELDDRIRNATHLYVNLKFKIKGINYNGYDDGVQQTINLSGPGLLDSKPPEVTSVTAAPGAYLPGQKVPITAGFSEVVIFPESGGDLVTSKGTGHGFGSARNVYNTALIELAEGDYGTIELKKITGFKDPAENRGLDYTQGKVFDRVTVVPSIYEALKTPAAASVRPVYDELTGKTTATARVEIPLPTNQTERDLVVGSYTNAAGVICNDKFAASIDGSQTLVPFTYDNNTNPTKLIATFPIDVADIQPTFVMEIYNITVNGDQPAIGEVVFGRYGAFSVNEPIPLTSNHLSVKQPLNWPTEGIYLNNLPELKLEAQLTGAEDCTWTQYEWKSTDETVATIGAQDGKISFLREGKVQFYLAAVNGGLEKYQGDGFESERSGEITVQQGATPYITIAQRELSVRAGEPVTVRWASNIAQKNEEFTPQTPTEFEITVKDASGAVIKTQTVTFDPADKGATDEERAAWPNQAFTFTDLNAVSSGGKASYTVTVTGKTHAGVPGHLAEGFTSEEMEVYVVSQPVTVKLARPENLVITDAQEIFQVDFTLENFDGLNDADFRVSVTNNATGEKVAVGDVPPTESGSFTFPLVITDGFRNIYDVTVEAKNPAENSWSRDSYTLYVYDSGCLSIVVPEGENGRVTVDGDRVTLDNNPWIASLSQDDIIALKRDINLKTLLSINYGDHDWSEAIDRIQWKSEDSGVASVNYPMQSTYANIEDLPYTSFAPATEFLLSGNSDGKTIVEAIHPLSGGALHDEVEVEVKTLLDKLYLFQSYPAGVTTLTYQNGLGEEKTVQSNEKGQAAIYEPSGIQGEVYFQAELGNDTYLGTFYNDTLRTQEYNAASLALYPLNTIEMKQASTAPVYLKKPDGTDYSGTVQVRAGVYRNGVYCGEAMVDRQPLGTGTGENAADYTVNFADGKHEFQFDISQFDVKNQGPVSPAEQLDFVFELRAEGYYPVLYKLNGSLNGDQVIRLGEQIVSLEAVSSSAREKPFIAQQRVYFSDTAVGPGVDVRGLSTRMGPSRDNPKLLLETVVAWWGEDAGQKVDIATKNDVALGALPETDTKYPFTSFDVTVTRTPLNDDSMRAAGIGDLAGTALRANYIKTDGTTAKREDLPFTVINATSLKSVVSPEDWTRNLDALKTMGRSSSGGIDAGEGFMKDGLKQSTLLDIDLGFLKMQLSPTEDPLVYNAYLFAGLNNIENDNVSGAQADVSRGSDFDPGPGFKDVASVLKDGLLNYGQTAANKVKYAASILKNNIRQGKGTSVSEDGDTLFALSGYFETKVYYDGESWKMVLVNGGLTAGGGYGRHMIFNTQVGPVPMFLDLGYGLSGVVNFKAAVNHTYNYNDYLTELRINGYFQAFGGFGFDYTVLAMKIGLYGQVNVDVQLRWLHAMEASNPKVGAKIGVSGSVGFKLQLRILFISYEKILWSYQFPTQTWPIGDWQAIEDYWDAVGKGTFQGIPANTRLLTANQLMADESSGQAMFEAQGEATLIDRDYLADAGDRWGGGRNGFSLFAVRDGMETILSPAYPEANPVLSTDGSYMFYLDDLRDANKATALRAAASPRTGGSGSSYLSGQVLDEGGFGDSYLKSAGTGEDSVVVWSRIMEEPVITEAGETITPNIQAMMLNSSDIMVATREDGSWKVEQLTNNGNVADTAPAVASNGTRTVVVWRQTASSSSENITNFNAKDYIMYRVKENGTWTDAAPLYIGDLGAVKGLEAHMLDSGETLVTFVTDTTGAQDCSGQEVVYAVIASEDAAGGEYKKNEVSHFVRLTSDDYLDENPQLTSATYQGQAYFILGWHSYNGGSGVAESDIRLAAIDGSGNRLTNFVDRLSTLTQNSGTRIGSNFRFVKNAESLENLSILWSEVAVEEKTDTSAASKEKITGIRFRVDGGDIGVTAAQELVVMDDSTTANLFDGYVAKGGDIELVVLGTYYDMEQPQANFVTDGVGVQTVFTPKQTTSIYKASGYFSDKIRLEEPIPDYNQIRLGADLPVLFHLTNAGATPIEKVEITVGGETTTFEAGGASGFVSLKPGENRDLFAYCLLPADEIQNADYSVTATFKSGETDEASGTVVLKIPDLGITANESVIEAKDGKRTLQFTLFNMSDTKLKGSDNEVCFQLFTDPSCEIPVDSKYLSLIQQTRNSPEALLTIADGDSLEKIDEGRLSLQYSFDVASYIQQTTGDGQTPFADDAGEIRDGGITLYAKAWVETSDGKGGMGEMMEYRSDNNISAFTVESLLKQSDNEPVKIQSELTADGGETTVAVTLQNNSIVESQDGNLSVTLLDDQNNIVGWQQSYDEDGKLFTLTPEQEYEKAFTFPGVSGAARALVTFDKKVTLSDDATLNQFSATGVPVNLSKFTQQPDGSYSATVTAEDMTNTVVTASPNSTKSTVTISASTPEVKTTLLAAEASGGTKTVTMSPGGTTVITATVRAENGTEKTYTLTITNKNSAPDILDQTPEVNTVYGADTVTVSVTANAKDNESARLNYQWYRYDGSGRPGNTSDNGWNPVEGATEVTYTIDKGGLAAGTHYYYCKVTSTNKAGTPFTLDSEIVPVDVSQADTPTINWPKVVTPLTFGDPLSKAGEDLKSGSLSFPNQFIPPYEIGTFAWTQPEAIPTVDTTQANAVYTPSQEILQNYKSFALMSGNVPQMLDITVNKAAAPAVTWPTAAAITYGQTLEDAVLSGGALNFGGTFDFMKNPAFSGNPIGTFAWNQPNTVPTVDNNSFQVDYAASDFVQTNYGSINETSHTTALTVNRAAPTVNVETNVSTQKIGNPVTATIMVTNPHNAGLIDGFPEAGQVKVTGSISGRTPESLEVTAVQGRPGVYQTTFQIPNDARLNDAALTFSVMLDGSGNYQAVTEAKTAQVGITNKSVHMQSLTGLTSVVYGNPAVFTTRLENGNYGQPAAGQPTGTMTYQLNGRELTGRSQKLTVTADGSTAALTLDPSDLPVGSYVLTARYSGDSDYQSSTQNINFTVSPRPVTATVDDITAYVGAVPALTVFYDGLPTGVTGLRGIAAQTTATGSSPAGSYPITLTEVSGEDAKNYAVTAIPGTLILKPNFGVAPIALPEKPDAERHIPAVAVEPAELEKLKDQITDGDLANLKLMVTPVEETGEEAKSLLAKLNGYRAPENGTGLYDVSLVDAANGNKVLEFDGCATLTFPYPKGASDSNYWFVALHLKDGAVSAYTPVTTGDGLQITVKNGFSPFLVAYTFRYSGGGGSSGVSSNVTVTTPPATPEQPNPPTNGESKVAGSVDKDGNATVKVPDQSITDAINAAKKQAGQNGISVTINITLKETANRLTVSISKPALDRLIAENVRELKITSSLISMSFNSEALKEMQKSVIGDWIIMADKLDVNTLSTAAQAAIGSRPAFALSMQSGGKAITGLGKDSASVWMPYTLAANESAGNVQAVYVDEKGAVSAIIGSSYDTNTKMLMFSTNHFSIYGVGYKQDTPKLTDITNHWAKSDIEFVVARGLLSGTGGDQFSPDSGMTRAMFVTALGRLAGIDPVQYQTGAFTDVPANTYYAPYVNWAAAKGIVKGTTQSTFDPNRNVTRQEMAVIMQGYATAMGYTLIRTRDAVTFADSASIGSWAGDAVRAMQQAGILMGKDGNRFDPTGTATRGEAAAVLHRFVELVIDPATAQGWDKNDSGKWVYYVDGKPVTGGRTIDGTTYHFDEKGQLTKIDAIAPVTKKYLTYVVKQGDTLWAIAASQHCTVAEIVARNNSLVEDPNKIIVGWQIKIPQK